MLSKEIIIKNESGLESKVAARLIQRLQVMNPIYGFRK